MAGDPETKTDLQSAEAESHQSVSPTCRCNQCDGARGHQANAHHRNNPDGESASGDDGGAVEEQPNSRKGGCRAGVEQGKGEQPTDDDRRGEAKQKFATGTLKQSRIRAVGLCGSGGSSDGDGYEGFG